MNRRLSSVFFVLGLLVALLAGSVVPAAASTSTEGIVAPMLLLQQPGTVDLGESFVLSGSVQAKSDQAATNQAIFFFLDGEALGRTRVDSSGNFERKFNNQLDAGSYRITAVLNSSDLTEEVSASAFLTVLPATVGVQTVPAIAGVAFEINGQKFYSDHNGLATTKINHLGTYRLSVLVDEYDDPSQQIQFGRWLEEVYEPYLDIRVPDDKVYQVGLDVYHQVSQSFLDLDGDPIDDERITEFMIRSAQGDVFSFSDGQPRWIPASRVARRVTGLEETRLLYSVISVTVDGSNVVNQSQQRFYTHPDDTWPISLLLYSLRISLRDGLFGSAIGTAVNLEFPDGQIKTYMLDGNGTVEIKSLARGTYYIEPVGVKGMINRVPVALSRNQEVVSKVLTYLDLGVVGTLGAAVAVGLLLYGRPWLLRSLIRSPGAEAR